MKIAHINTLLNHITNNTKTKIIQINTLLTHVTNNSKNDNYSNKHTNKSQNKQL